MKCRRKGYGVRGKGEAEGFPSSARGGSAKGVAGGESVVEGDATCPPQPKAEEGAEQGVWFPASWRGLSRVDAPIKAFVIASALSRCSVALRHQGLPPTLAFSEQSP
jgi:hypothetical protein